MTSWQDYSIRTSIQDKASLTSESGVAFVFSIGSSSGPLTLQELETTLNLSVMETKSEVQSKRVVWSKNLIASVCHQNRLLSKLIALSE